jgi:hypothetical protein
MDEVVILGGDEVIGADAFTSITLVGSTKLVIEVVACLVVGTQGGFGYLLGLLSVLEVQVKQAILTTTLRETG